MTASKLGRPSAKRPNWAHSCRIKSVPTRHRSLQPHVEGEEAIEERRFPIEMTLSQTHSRNLFRPVFQKAEPKQWSQDAGFHQHRAGVPSRFKDADHRYGAEASQFPRRLPIRGGNAQRPEQDARVELRPRAKHASAEIAEIGMPECDVDENRLEGPLSSLFQQITSQPRWLQNASIGPNEPRQRCDVADKEKRHEVRLIDDLRRIPNCDRIRPGKGDI